MIRYFFIIILLLSINIGATETLRLDLKYDNDNFKLLLINVSNRNILVNKRFAISSHYNVDFIIENEKGKNIASMVFADSIWDITAEECLVLLEPHEIFGLEVDKKSLIELYSLTSGKYKVMAFYINTDFADKGAFIGKLTSDWVNFEVKENELCK